MIIRYLIVSFLFLTTCTTTAMAGEYNFPDRKAIILNYCPHINITKYEFQNYEGNYGSSTFHDEFDYENISKSLIIAFSITIARFNAFDERMPSVKYIVPGNSDSDWSPIAPGESEDSDLMSAESSKVFTSILYIDAVRFIDGTIWRADQQQLAAELAKVAPGAGVH